MDLTPHDLIRVTAVDCLIANLPLPKWATVVLEFIPVVVVRRAPVVNGCIPVGLRGFHRGQRLALWLPLTAIESVYTPAMLANPLNWKTNSSANLKGPIVSLSRITPVLNKTGFSWGPGGSTGFELATGYSTITETSDLDIVISVNNAVTKDYMRALYDELESISNVRMDIQLNCAVGGFSLKEFISSDSVLLKGLTGPSLVSTDKIWHMSETGNLNRPEILALVN